MFAEPLHVGRPNIGSRERFIQLADGILERGWLTNNGPLVQELESRIAHYLGCAHCVLMCNGTIALEIATRALDLRGEVIVPSYTFVATAHALQWQEITPVFADIEVETHNLDPESVRKMITPRTTGILGVHLWGRAAKVDELQGIAREFGLRLMFDASHGFGCSHAGQMLGCFGECEVFSFHATKFFNTFEGGAVVTDNPELAEKTRLMRNFGFAGFDNVIYPGTNGKMAEISAAMGLTNLEQIDHFVEVNRSNYEQYRRAISKIPGLSLLRYDELERNNFQYVVVEVGPNFPASRDRIVEVLHKENILARKYFWPGCHNMQPYRAYYPNVSILLPNTNAVAERVIVLPTGSTIGSTEIEGIVQVLTLLGTGAATA